MNNVVAANKLNSNPSLRSPCIAILEPGNGPGSAIQPVCENLDIDVYVANSSKSFLKIFTEHMPIAGIIDVAHHTVPPFDLIESITLLAPDTSLVLIGDIQDRDLLFQLINCPCIRQIIPPIQIEERLKTTITDAICRNQEQFNSSQLQNLIQAQHQQLAQTYESLRHEMVIGGRIHEVLLKGQTPANIKPFDIASYSVASKEIDGDFFDFYHPIPDYCDVVIGDVMGKGIPAALVGTAVKTQLIRFAVPSHSTTICGSDGVWRHAPTSPDVLMAHVQKEIAGSLLELEYFVTLFYGQFNLPKRELSYVDCGSTKPLHYSAKRNAISELEGDNFPLGMIANDEYALHSIQYEQGDWFILYSDGATEARNPDGELFGIDRLKSIVSSQSNGSATEMVDRLRRAIIEHAAQKELDDDLTIVAIKVDSDVWSAKSSIRSASFSSSTEQLPAVRQYIEQLCANTPGDTEALTAQLQLAVNEIFCNICKHGYEASSRGEISIRGQVTGDGIHLEIGDQSGGYDPLQSAAPDLTGNMDGGYGLYIIKEIADSVSYEKRTDRSTWNRTKLFKSFLIKDQSMELPHAKQGEVLVISLKVDSLDAKKAPTFKEKVLDLISSQGSNDVVLDLGALQFIDSSGLGSLLSVLRHLNSNSGDLRIANMTKPIRAMFEIVRMHKLFEIFNSTDDAVRSYDA